MKVVAITSCLEGIAFTYMAAIKLENSAKSCGISIFVEKQGQGGIEDRLPSDAIEHADFVILAIENSIQEMERFKGKRVLQCSVKTPIQLGESIFELAQKESTIL